MMTIKPLILGCFLSLVLFLAGGSGSVASVGGTSNSADFTAEKNAAAAGKFEMAITYFTKVVAVEPTNADGYKLLGFSYRKLGNAAKAFEHYNAALALNPDHLGANEYIGELYLERGDLANAEKHLKMLDGACFFGREAYDDLKQAIETYKTQQDG